MPVPPNQRRKTASVMTLPSGEGDPVVDRSVLPNARPGALRVTGMPREGRVYFNDNELTGIGWADPVAMTAYDVEASGLNFIGELTITDANGVVYKWPDGNPIDTRSGASYFNFNEFVRQGPIPVYLGVGLIPAATTPPRRSITDVPMNDSIDRSNNTGAVFLITGVPSDVVSLIVQENARVLSGTLAGGMWTASSFDVSDAAVISVQPTTAGGVMGEGLRGRALTRTVAIPAAGLSIAYSTLAAPTTQYRRVGEGGTGSLTVTGEPGWVVALAASGSTTPIAASPIPSSGSISIPVPVGSYNLGVQNANGVRAQSITVTSTGLTVDTRTFAATPAPPAMTGIVLVGDTNSIGGATFSLDGVAVPYAPGAAQWLPTTPAYTKLFLPATAGARVVRLIKGGQTLIANATVAADQVTEIPVSNMTVETRSTTQQVTNSNTGIVLVGDIASIGGATFSLDGVAVPYALGAAQWLPTTPANTRLFIPATAGAHTVRLIKGGRTLIANSTVAANMVTDVPVSEMQQEMLEMPKAEDKKEKLPAVVPQEKLPPFVTTRLEPGNVGPLPPLSVEQTMPPPTPTPGMSMTSKLIIGGLVAAAVGGGYYWYSMQPKANPGKKDCGCGCKGGCGG